ncbi:MAG: hypothetical protein JW941_00100 [Candidatus Coatesbacteria bacterium]|nr:hypothetical protein [Candidatus Coatesbacteria bacterium]
MRQSTMVCAIAFLQVCLLVFSASGQNTHGVDPNTCQIFSRYWSSGTSPIAGSDEYWAAFNRMAQEMITFWGKIDEMVGSGGPWIGSTCPDVTPGLSPYEIGALL